MKMQGGSFEPDTGTFSCIVDPMLEKQGGIRGSLDRTAQLRRPSLLNPMLHIRGLIARVTKMRKQNQASVIITTNSPEVGPTILPFPSPKHVKPEQQVIRIDSLQMDTSQQEDLLVQ